MEHPSLTKDVKDCLRRTWLDGEVYLSDTRLYSLLCQLLGEAAEKTGRKQLVAMQDWTEVASELASWTTSANKRPATETGPFQLALVKERTVQVNDLPVTRNIMSTGRRFYWQIQNSMTLQKRNIRSRQISGLSIGLLASTTSRASFMS